MSNNKKEVVAQNNIATAEAVRLLRDEKDKIKSESEATIKKLESSLAEWQKKASEWKKKAAESQAEALVLTLISQSSIARAAPEYARDLLMRGLLSNAPIVNGELDKAVLTASFETEVDKIRKSVKVSPSESTVVSRQRERVRRMIRG